MGYIPVFTVWKYLVSGIYQRGDLKLKSVKISVQGPFNKMTTHQSYDISDAELYNLWLLY